MTLIQHKQFYSRMSMYDQPVIYNMHFKTLFTPPKDLPRVSQEEIMATLGCAVQSTTMQDVGRLLQTGTVQPPTMIHSTTGH